MLKQFLGIWDKVTFPVLSIIWVGSKFCHKRDCWWQQAHICVIHSITQLFSHMIEASKLSD